MGLIARELEQAGISTVTLVNYRPHTECVLPPRAAYVKYPFGAQWGPPRAREAQRELALAVLELLSDLETPGTIIDMPFSWAKAKRSLRAKDADS